MVSFALGTALLSLLLSSTTYLLIRRNLFDQRETLAISQVDRNAQLLQRQITNTNVTTEQLSASLQSVVASSNSHPVIQVPNQAGEPTTGATSARYSLDAIPTSLQDKVEADSPAMMRIDLDGEPVLIVGVPIEVINAQYYEIISLQDIKDTLSALTTVLLFTVAGTTLLGLVAGLWASRRVLRPLSAAGLAAEAIATGRLGTRLEDSPDPDLEPLVESFNHMASALEARIDQDARFTSDVSHELRSPLMTLAASMEVIEARKDELPPGPLSSAVELMSADLARFQQLVEDLLEISRYDAGAIRLHLTDINIVDLVIQVIASQHLDVPVISDPELTDTLVRVDKRRLSRVIANLLDNAEKYGDGATSVEVRIIDDHVRIIVEDNGPGIPDGERSVIFDRFSRGSGSGRRSTGTSGVGLGLSLVTEHIQLQGGQVWAEDRPDGESGARFVVDLASSPSHPIDAEELT